MMKDPVREYREAAVRGASPVGLVVILFEEALRSVKKAQRALREGNIERRTLELTHVLEVLGYLQSTLDFTKGGEVAVNLSRFYDVARTKILEANLRADDATMEWLATQLSSHIDAWQQVDRDLTSKAAEHAPASLEPAKAVASRPRARTLPPGARGRR
ncbi:MAG TPA: flagellar export chaperone FliS [Candidatus Sulfotelmatobacter sp.]|nr:flagellar export chaperone FliS [Candidatus Sulfotelmatobacter sp.]